MRAGDDLIYVFLGLLELERLMICALVAVRLLVAPIVPCNGPNVSTAIGSKLTVPINRRPVAGIADVSERESLELRTGSVLKVNRQNCFFRFTRILQSVSSEGCFVFFFETHFPLVAPSPQESALPLCTERFSWEVCPQLLCQSCNKKRKTSSQSRDLIYSDSLSPDRVGNNADVLPPCR